MTEEFAEYRLMSDDELVSEHERLNSLIETVDDCDAFSRTIVGKRTIERIRKDLAAVTMCYAKIKGNNDEMARELCRNQGREKQIRQELAMIGGEENYKKGLTNRTEFVRVQIETRKTQKTNRR